MTKRDLLLNPTLEFSAEQTTVLVSSLEQLCRHVPVQHVTGCATFYGRTFAVSPAVLIPRGETEQLVQLIISENTANEAKYSVGDIACSATEDSMSSESDISGSSTKCANTDTHGIYEETETTPRQSCAVPESERILRILDIGTGSGVIGISLGAEIAQSQVVAWDISDKALDMARRNAAALGVSSISFALVDILSTALPEDDHFDIIVSNPPYVCDSEREFMRENVLDFEPPQALFVDDSDPLIFYRQITNFARARLVPGGRLYFEINERFGTEVEALMRRSGFENTRVIRDIHSRHRFTRANVAR